MRQVKINELEVKNSLNESKISDILAQSGNNQEALTKQLKDKELIEKAKFEME